MSFILGCNYWASNAGIEMWKSFDPGAIEGDLRALSEHGMEYLRVFPLWRDFQPVAPLLGGQGAIIDYSQDGKEPENNYYLDSEMMKRFEIFLDLCDRYGIKVIVGLITGWMSGSLMIPTALYGKNVITDPIAQYFEQLFIKGFVTHFKNRDTVYAWDLGNECNGMAPVSSRFEAASWAAAISNAIRAADPTRPVFSGMHGLSLTQKWTIADQAEFTDMLTTHPYPFWCEHSRIDETLSYRITLLPTAQGKYYSDISKKPCITEEFGTMGPMVCSDTLSADFLRVNLFSLWANGNAGVLWWCNSDQTKLETFPYTHQMVERELGLITEDGRVKPQLLEFKKFSELLKRTGLTLPPYESDAVCILSRGQRHWGVAYMTYLLARRAGLNIRFAYGDEELPDAKIYLLPSVSEYTVLVKKRYDELKERIKAGATLYLSIGNTILSEFEALTGLRVTDSYECGNRSTAEVNGSKVEFFRKRTLWLEPLSAKVIARDSENDPFITENRYGSGRVYFVNAPIEDNLIDAHDFMKSSLKDLYKTIFGDVVDALPVKISDSDLLTTRHIGDGEAYVTVINHFNTKKEFTVSLSGYEPTEVIYGDLGSVDPYDACIFKFKKV